MSRNIDAFDSYSGGGGYGSVAEDTAGGMGLMDAFRIIRRRWYLVILGLLVTFVPAWFLAPQTQDMHEARAVVWHQNVRQSYTPGGDGVTIDPVSIDFMTSQSQIVTSQGLLGEVVDAEGSQLHPGPGLSWSLLSEIEIFGNLERTDTLFLTFDTNGFTVRSAGGEQASGRYGEPVEVADVRFALAEHPSGQRENFIVLEPRQTVIRQMLLRLLALPREETAVLDIIYRDYDEDRAIDLTNAIARVYEDYNTRDMIGDAQRRVDFLEQRLLEANGELDRARQALREFQDIDRVFGSATRITAEQQNLVALEDERRRLEEERRIYVSFLSRIDGASPDLVEAELRTLMAAPAVAASPVLSPMFQQLNVYQLERARLLAGGLSATHPQVVQQTDLIAATRAQIEESVRTQLAALDIQIRSVDDQRAQTRQVLAAMPSSVNEEQRLQAEVTAAQAALETLRTEYQSARLAAELDVGQVQVLERATDTIVVAVGRRIQILVIAFVLGLVLGGGGALVVEANNQSVRGRRDVEEILSIPGLGVIPKIELDGVRKSRLLGRSDEAANGKKVYVGSMAEPLVPDVKPELQQFHTLAAEAYRMLRTNLTFLHPDRDLRTLVVSSASSGEGKTTTAANLAVAFARQGKRVLLVDCDLRRPRLHTFFNLDVKPGFTDLILGNANGEVIRPTGIERLSLLPRGEFDERAGEVLSGRSGGEIIEKLRDQWDLVIFDTSPVLLTADAMAVAPYTDGVLLVVRAGQTPRDAARQAMQQLQVVGANVLGFVLNDPDAVGQLYGEQKYTRVYYAVDV